MNHQQLAHVQFPLQNPQAGQLPPPARDAVGDALDTLGQQAPQMAHVNVQAQLNAILNSMNRMIDGINNLEERVTTLEERVTTLEERITTMDGHVTTLDQRTARIEADLAMLPIRMLNASASDTVPLVYPPPHVRGGVLPDTKYDALRINGAEALAALQALNAPNIPNTAAERVKYFHDYMGLRTPAL